VRRVIWLALVLLCVAAGPTDHCGPGQVAVTYPNGEVVCAQNAWASNGFAVTYSEYAGEYWHTEVWVAGPGSATMSYNGMPFAPQGNAGEVPWDRMGWRDEYGVHVKLTQVTTSEGAQ